MTIERNKMIVAAGCVLVSILSYLGMQASPETAFGRIIYVTYTDVVFPFAWLTAVMVGHFLGLIYLVCLIQFPIYSIILGNAWLRGQFRRVLIYLVGLHVFAAAICRVLAGR